MDFILINNTLHHWRSKVIKLGNFVCGLETSEYDLYIVDEISNVRTAFYLNWICQLRTSESHISNLIRKKRLHHQYLLKARLINVKIEQTT